MKEQDLESLADKLAREGKGHQAIFDELALTSDAKLSKIAEILRKTPSLKKRQRYKPSNMALSGIFMVAIIIHLLLTIDALDTSLLSALSELVFFVIMPLIILYGIYNYKRNAHLVAAFYMLLNLIMSAAKLFSSLDPVILISLLCSIAAAIIGFYLDQVLSSDYIYQKTLHQEHPDLREGLMKFEE